MAAQLSIDFASQFSFLGFILLSLICRFGIGGIGIDRSNEPARCVEYQMGLTVCLRVLFMASLDHRIVLFKIKAHQIMCYSKVPINLKTNILKEHKRLISANVTRSFPTSSYVIYPLIKGCFVTFEWADNQDDATCVCTYFRTSSRSRASWLKHPENTKKKNQ